MNQSFIYNFKTREIINPLDGIMRFYVNPYMPQSAQTLNIEGLWNQHFTNNDSEVKFINGVPVIVFPFDILNLETASVRISSSDKYVIKSGNMTLYVKLFPEIPYLCRIDTILIN